MLVNFTIKEHLDKIDVQLNIMTPHRHNIYLYTWHNNI